MTGEEFEAAYAARSGITVDSLRGLGRVVLPCDRGEDGCEGWQSISTDSADDEIRLHRPWERHEGWVCKGCLGWIDPGAPRSFVTVVNQRALSGALVPEDGLELARVSAFHERCAPAQAALPE